MKRARIICIDEHGNVIDCNRKALEIFGSVENIPGISGEVWEYNGRFYSVAEYPLGAVKAIVLRDITEIKELEGLQGKVKRDSGL